MGKTEKNIREFAFIGFILLAVLFGMQIMTFIFGNLGEVDQFDDVVQTVINESGAYVNATGYTLVEASQSNFSGGAVVTAVWLNVSNSPWLLSSVNYTVSSATGVLTNATEVLNATEWEDANVSYTTNHKTEAEVVSEDITNQSLRSIGNYAGQSGTQFTTLGIAITLILLVAVFLFFWKSFMGKGKEGSPGSFS